jgi:hypothetical protein
MPIKHKEIEIPFEDPFKNCKLDRKKYAEILTSTIKEYSDGFVLAINNEWGAGKTTFIKMWQRMLENEGMKTIYFNAWENDFQLNPMTAILSELKGISIGNDEKLKNVLEKGKIIAKNTIPTILKGLLKKYTGIEELGDFAEGAATAGVEIIESEIDEYQKKKEGLQHFRNALEDYVSSNCPFGTPLLFLVDELDRCRPDYAVQLLEHMKHFFNVPGVVFALSIDKGQLENSIKGFFGSENINGNEYLRRFIDIEFRIPEPSSDNYLNYLFDYFEFGNFFHDKIRQSSPKVNRDPISFLTFANIIFKEKKINLRQQEKIFSHARISLRSFATNNYVYPEVFLFLTYLFLHHSNFYSQLQKGELSIHECINHLEEIIPLSINTESQRLFLFVEANILYLYNDSIKSHNGYFRLLKIIGENGSKKLIPEFDSKFKNNPVFEELLNQIYWLSENRESIHFEFILNRISLLEYYQSL